MPKITFTNTSGFPDIEQPQPASKYIPSWYKEIESYVGGEKMPGGDGVTLATIKRCMPVFDAVTSGYMITLPADVWVSIKDEEQYFEWSSFGLVQFHAVDQAPTHPLRNQFPYAKWMNYWAIKTPPGYSTLFIQPMHHDLPFTIMPGVVDTDKYTAPVNFPMVINDPEFQGLIPKGTPIAQVIPFKRESWQMEKGNQDDFIEQNNVTASLHTKFFDRYKSMFRTVKEYK